MAVQYKSALVIGAGAFGTSIASVLAKNFQEVILKVRSKDVYEAIRDGRENSVYLPGTMLAKNIYPALEWHDVDTYNIENVELVILGLPTSALANYFKDHGARLKLYLDRGIPFVLLSKGIDPDTLEMSDDLVYDAFPQYRDLFTFLSGPSFAKEIMQAQITLVTVAGRSKKTLTAVSQMLDCSYFKAFPSYDVRGVLLGGALKNVLAIAGGIIEGLGFNHNTRAAMITRGIVEMLRFGAVFNARPETFYGLSGMGDLILTTTSGLSRNKTFGLEIAKGRLPSEIIASQRTVVEGYKTTQAAHFLSEKYDIRASIFNGLYEVLYEGATPQEVIKRLMGGKAGFEVE